MKTAQTFAAEYRYRSADGELEQHQDEIEAASMAEAKRIAKAREGMDEQHRWLIVVERKATKA